MLDRSQLQLSALCSRASKQTNKPWGENRDPSSLSLLKKKNHLLAVEERKEPTLLDVDSAVTATEGRQRRWEFLRALFCQLERLFWTTPATIHICESVHLKQTEIPLVFTYDKLQGFFFSIPNEKLLFGSLLFTNDLFLSKNAPQYIANRWEQKSLAGAGKPGMYRSNA